MIKDDDKTSLETAKQDYDLTCWYLNQRRVMELVGPDNMISQSVRDAVLLGDAYYKRLALEVAAKDALVGWIREYQPETLGQLLLSERAMPGTMFTHFSDFYCTGLANYEKAKRNHTRTSYPQIYCDVKGLGHDVRLRLRYNPDHLTGDSSYARLTGHSQLFVLAAIDRECDGVLDALPYVIATPIPDLGRASSKGKRWSWRLEVFVDNIDSFSLAKSEPPPRQRDLSLLRSVPEERVKRAFAEIIREPIIPKDWGGERSDLFSSFVILDGGRISTAFAFKGPAKFAPMTMADLGKNGDQIDRLFSEPADLLILQHCHNITTPVRGAMRAYATRVSDLRLFCLINGYDTIRILRAYSKCGFTPTPKSDLIIES